MKKTKSSLMNRANCAVIAILGAITANAELAKEPIYDAENVSVGYKVTGLNDGKEEAVVFTNHLRTATWTVPATLNNVQFLVVGGGGGGGGGTWGPGGGGGGVVTGYVYKLEKDATVNVKVGKGGSRGTSNGAYGGVGGNSSIIVGETTYVLAYGGGAGGNKANGVNGGSGSGGGADSNSTKEYIGGNPIEAKCAEGVLFAESFGHAGGSNGTRAYCSGGGGGAMGVGTDARSATGGTGGAGLEIDITGTPVMYGSGGGGGGSGARGLGGTNAGNGGTNASNATSAKANAGGGGGGGGKNQWSNGDWQGYGGNGGSGIVVFRYALPTGVAKIGDAEYATLGEAIEAAGTQDEVVVVADITTDAAFEITKKVAINLNGKTIATTEKDTEGNGVFWVKNGGELTLNGEGTVNGVGGNAYNIAIWADGGKVIINGGTYTNEGAQDDGPDGAHFDLIYAKNGGSVEINGGTFKCETPNWTLNSHDTAKGTIVVKGGTFYQFNPANCTTEGANTNFCADGLCGYVVETVGGVDVYGVAAAVATIGEAKFVSLDAAIAAAGADDEVVVVADIATDAAFEITKKVTIDLNGKTIAMTEKDTEGNGVFWVKAGGELTLNGEGTINGVGGNAYNIAIWADGGKVIINGGTYTNVGAQDSGPDGAHFDLIYAKNGGSVEINGGTFKCQTPKWTLNSHDTAKGTIVVKGGTFYQFNPNDCATEGPGTNFCADGYAGLPNLNDEFVVGVMPTATVKNLGSMTIPAKEHYVYNGSLNPGTEEMPLNFVMQFVADQKAGDMATSPFADWYGDFVISFEGIENGSFDASGCYLAGYYGSTESWDGLWVKIPVDGHLKTIREGERYPVMLGVGMAQTYNYICSGVQAFSCAMYIPDEILKANPNLKVKLELNVVDSSKGEEVAKNALVNGENIFNASDTEYTVEDFKKEEAVKLYIRIVDGKPQIGFEGEGTLVLEAAATLTGEWTKNISYTIVENDGDDTKTWVTPAEGYYFFKGFITK